jgi:hypothetical protein
MQEQRVILTHDADYLRAAAAGHPHAGILYCSTGARSVGELVRYLCLIHDCMTVEERQGRIEFI